MSKQTFHKSSPFTFYLSTCFLFFLFAQMLLSAVEQSPTYDEGYYLVSGYAFVRLGDLHIRDGAPILLSALHALPLLSLPDLRLPVDDPAWNGSDFHPLSEQFLWHINSNADQIIFLARIPAILLTLLLAAFVGRWAGELFGPWGGLLALGLCAFDPNIIAHGALAATDGGATALIFIATYWLWRWMSRGGWGSLLLTGIGLGLAQCTRFSALLMAPIWAVLWGWHIVRQSPRRWPATIGAGLFTLLIAYMTIWAVHGFQIGPIAGKTTWPVPAPAWWEELFYIIERMGRPAQAFLLGQIYEGGRWAYFPVALALKTPIPTLIWLVGAVVIGPGKKIPPAAWLPPVLFFAFSMAGNLNLGYRYILPIVPFLLLLTGQMGHWLADNLGRLHGERRAVLVAAVTLVGGWSVWSALSVCPHDLAFFNEWAGGPDGGWRYLVDSNLDWGQGLKGLKRWMDQNGVERVKLAYMGEAYPSYYGIAFDPLPSLPDRWQHPLYHDLYPPDPAPGLYAISATLLQGVNLADPDTYAWFRTREPIAKIGYSIFIYDVPKHGTGQAVIGLAGLSPADIRPQDYAALGTNDVRVLWFDAARAMAFPEGDNVSIWVAGGGPHPALSVWLRTPNRESTLRDGRPVRIFEDISRHDAINYVYSLTPDERLPVRIGPLTLIGYRWMPDRVRPGEVLTWTGWWQVVEPAPEPITLFVHLLDAQGINRAGEDRGDVWYDNWQPGDLFVQVQEVALPTDLASGTYEVEVGGYTPRTMIRLPVWANGQVAGDHALLAPVHIE